VCLVPVGGPLPDVADHVDQAVAVGRVAADRCGPDVPVLGGVVHREITLPGVGHPAAGRGELVAPGELGPVQPAAGGELPLGLGRHRLAGPGRVRLDIGPGDVHDRVVRLALDRAAGAVRVPPVGARHIRPPLVRVGQRHRVIRAAEHRRGRRQQLRPGPRVASRVGRALGHRDVPGGPDETAELGIGHRMRVDPEAVDRDRMRRRLLRVVVVGAHPERAARYPNHALRPGAGPSPIRARQPRHPASSPHPHPASGHRPPPVLTCQGVTRQNPATLANSTVPITSSSTATTAAAASQDLRALARKERTQPLPTGPAASSAAARSRRAEASSEGATITRTPSICSCGYCPPASSAATAALKP
jgi:hypothetical protein